MSESNLSPEIVELIEGLAAGDIGPEEARGLGDCPELREALANALTARCGRGRFYNVQRGLRGGYMPDDSRNSYAANFREFARDIGAEIESHNLETTRQLQFAWRELIRPGAYLPVCVATNRGGEDEYVARGHYGLMVGPSSASDMADSLLADSE